MPGLVTHSGVEAGEKFALTLAGSLILHFALIFGLQIRAMPAQHPTVSVIQVRLAEPHPGPAEAAPVAPLPPASPEAMELRSAEPVPAKPAPQIEPPAQPAASAASVDAADNLPAVDVPLIEDTTYYPAKEVDVHPAALQDIQPAYPEAAAFANVRGSVVLLLLLDEGGNVREISVQEANPPGFFEESAIEAFRAARFTPAQRNGKVVKSKVLIKVSFELNGDSGGRRSR